MKNIRLQLAIIEDIAILLEMMEKFNTIDGYDFDIKITKENLVDFITDPSLGLLWLIKIDKAIIGYIVLAFGFSFEHKGRDAFIDEFFIEENYRNNGFGYKVLDIVEQQAIKSKVNIIHLEVEHHNKRAKHMYNRIGFKRNKREVFSKKI